MSHLIVAVDTETTGLPGRSPAGSVRIMQLGYVVLRLDPATGKWARLFEYDRLLRLDPGTAVDPASQRIHGLDAARCDAEGDTLEAALAGLVGWLDPGPSVSEPFSPLLVGHNLDFDLGMLAQEARRLGREDWLRALGTVATACTMEMGREVCRLPRPFRASGFKNPKLAELFAHLFGGETGLGPLRNLHSAIVDARVCAACFLSLAKGVRGSEARGAVGLVDVDQL